MSQCLIFSDGFQRHGLWCSGYSLSLFWFYMKSQVSLRRRGVSFSSRSCANHHRHHVGFYAWEGLQNPEMVSMTTGAQDVEFWLIWSINHGEAGNTHIGLSVVTSHRLLRIWYHAFDDLNLINNHLPIISDFAVRHCWSWQWHALSYYEIRETFRSSRCVKRLLSYSPVDKSPVQGYACVSLLHLFLSFQGLKLPS